jgi:hypothetical protein
MLSINLQPYASDALEDAMRLAQTKALNSYSWSDMLNYLNYSWMTLYHRIISIDSGFYSRTIRLTERLTHIPPFLKNTINVYAAQRPVGFNREIFRRSGMNDLQSTNTYHISGFDLYCPAAQYRTVWLEYVPQQPMLFFTRNNRDPKLFEPNTHATIRSADCQLYTLHAYKPGEEEGTEVIEIPIEADSTTPADLLMATHFELKYKDATQSDLDADITDRIFFRGPEDWQVCYISCEFPYIFVTYKHRITGEYNSGFFPAILTSAEFVEYNPFAYTGKNSNVEYVETHWNDKTGMGVTVADWNDLVYDKDFDPENPPPRYINKGTAAVPKYYVPRYKELGWTPDTLLIYPSPEMYRYFVALLADKLATLNESEVMGVSRELVEAKFAFEAFLAKDKSAWVRLTNVNGPTLTDML